MRLEAWGGAERVFGVRRFATVVITSVLACLGLAACVSTPLPESGFLAEIPYRIDDGRLFVVDAMVNDQGPYSFVVDTGASSTVVTERLQGEIELSPIPGEFQLVRDALSVRTLPVYNVGSIEFNGERIEDCVTVIVPDVEAPINTERHFGILGLDFLSRYAIYVDSAQSVLRLYEKEHFRDRRYDGWANLPLEADNLGRLNEALYFADISVEDAEVRGLFDLGAGLPVFNWRTADAIGFSREDLLDAPDIPFVALMEVHEGAARIAGVRIQIAGLVWRDQTIAILDLPAFEELGVDDRPAGLFGASLLGNRDFILDFESPRVLISQE